MRPSSFLRWLAAAFVGEELAPPPVPDDAPDVLMARDRVYLVREMCPSFRVERPVRAATWAHAPCCFTSFDDAARLAATEGGEVAGLAAGELASASILLDWHVYDRAAPVTGGNVDVKA